MNHKTHYKLALLSTALVTLLALPLAQAATTSKADYQAAKTRIKADYSADKSACGSQSGNAKDICVKEADAVKVKAMADAKLGKEIGEARQDAAADKRDANYKVAIEKCDALAGDASDRNPFRPLAGEQSSH
jgi:hypothetical protein